MSGINCGSSATEVDGMWLTTPCSLSLLITDASGWCLKIYGSTGTFFSKLSTSMFGSLISGQAQGSRNIHGWSCANATPWLQTHHFSLGTAVKIGLPWDHTRAHTWTLVALWLCASVCSSGSQFLQYHKEIQAVNPKGNQSWIFIGRTDAEAETPILWPPDAKNWLIGKDPDAGKDWRREEKGTTEDEMVGWHHWLDGHEFG